MPEAENNLPGWKLLLVLLVSMSGISIALFNPAIIVAQQAGHDPQAGVLPFAVVTLILHFVILRHLTGRLNQVTLALNYLHQNKTVTPIPEQSGDLLQPLVRVVNAFIQERSDLKTMRGQLVEQISAAAAQEERNRLARDLHDSIKQQVFSMSISAAAAHAHLEQNPMAAREALLDVKQSAQEAMVEMRALLQQLSPAPLEKSGLIQALRDQCEALAYRTGAAVETHFGDLPPDDQLPPGTQESLFRIAQEALSNIARHARAHQVRLELNITDEQLLTLSITDDGQGFDPDVKTAGMGLNNIRTRAASVGALVEITSGPDDRGTLLTIAVPLIEAEEQEAQMQAQYENELKPIIRYFYLFAGGISVFTVSISMLIWRLLGRPDGITEDAFLMVILVVLVIATLGSLPLGIWSFLRASSGANELIMRAGRNSLTDLKMRRYRRMAYLIVSFAFAWFLPIMAIGLGLEPWLRVVIGVAFFLPGIWNYTRMGELYQQELALMTPTARYQELDKRVAEIRSSWVSVLILIPLVLVSTVFGGSILIPPQEPDHWMNVSFLTLSILLLINQIIGSVIYRRWRDEADQQRVSA